MGGEGFCEAATVVVGGRGNGGRDFDVVLGGLGVPELLLGMGVRVRVYADCAVSCCAVTEAGSVS